MRCLVIVGFNLKGSESQDYETIKSALEKKGLKHTISSASKISIELPATTYAGILEGESPKGVRMEMHAIVDAIIKEHGLRGKYLIAAGANSSVGAKQFS